MSETLQETDGMNHNLLEALLDSWDRNNTIMTGFLRAVPAAGLDARATADSPSVAQLFMHVRFARTCAVMENVAAFAEMHPERVLNDDQEWEVERDPDTLVRLLFDSAQFVRDAVEFSLNAPQREETGIYPHPLLLLQHMLWHEGYHLGQMKVALKVSGHAMPDAVAGPVTWGVWWREVGRE